MTSKTICIRHHFSPQHSSQAGLEHISTAAEDDDVQEVMAPPKKSKVPAPPKKSKVPAPTKKSKVPWEHDEEVILAKYWSTITQDSTTGNAKKLKNFGKG